MLAAGQLTISGSELLRAAAIDLELRPREELLRENERTLAKLSLVISLVQELVEPDVQQALYERFVALQGAPQPRSTRETAGA